MIQKKVAEDFVAQLEKEGNSKPVVLILQGDLGAGKTVFVKGIGEKLGVTNIISPTYIVCYEYKTSHRIYKKLHHCDFYILSEESELDHLGLDQMLLPGNLICIEWGEKSESLMNQFKEKAVVYLIQISHKNQYEREIMVSNI
jgi:tRNA threonylcarbamoyl adenosine modification protein YjeE